MASGIFGVAVDWAGGTAEIRWSSVANASANQSTVNVQLWAHTSGFTTFGNGSWNLRIGNDAVVSRNGISVSGAWQLMVERSRTVSHNSNGSLSIQIGVVSGEIAGTSWNSTSGLQTVTLDDIARPPGTGGTVTVSNIDTDSARFAWPAVSSAESGLEYALYVSTSSSFSTTVFAAWVGNVLNYTIGNILTPGTTYYTRVRARNNGGTGAYGPTTTFRTLPGAPAGAPTFTALTPTSVTVNWANPPGSTTAITGYEYQLSTNSGFTAIVGTIGVAKVNSDNTADNITLNPGTQYWVRVRAKIGTDVGPWSATGTFTTLPSTPPVLLVVPSASGTTATVTLSPPTGVAAADSYTVERRLQGTTTPVTTQTTTGNQIVATGLTPGATYEYRATATIGTYTSPFSNWVARMQPQPNTSPGSYFDGNSAPTANETFRWTSTPNKSTSELVGRTALNWAFAEAVNGGAALVTQVVGGWDRDYAARMLVTVSATGAGIRWGQELTPSPSDVVPLTTYYGSVYVNPSRSQRLSAEITWLSEALTVVARETNAGVIAPAGEWTRLSVTGAAPATAEFALLRIIDVTGTGWSVWQSGESMLADAAMLTLDALFPYFDGATVDSTDFTYDWEGAPDNSESTRTIVAVSNAPVLRDPDCPPLPSAPRPPAIPSDCIDETGVWRRYWSMIPANQVSTMLYVLPAVVVHVKSVALRQLRVRFYQAPLGVDDPNAIDPSTWVSEMVVSYVPANSTLILDSVEQRATATVGNSDPADAGHLLYGSNGAPVVWPVLNCGTNYFVSFDTPVTVPIGNQTFEAILTQKY